MECVMMIICYGMLIRDLGYVIITFWSTSSVDAPCFNSSLTVLRCFPNTAQWRGLLCRAASVEFTPAPALISNSHTSGALLNAATAKGVSS